MTVRTTALIVAAGSGHRMGGEPKQFRTIGGKSVLAHAIDALTHPRIDAVRVVIANGQQDPARAAIGSRDVGDFIVGGNTRSASVRNGLAAIGGEHVLVHDAARPFCPPEIVDALLDALETSAGVVPVLASVDTLARRHDHRLGDTVDREEVVRVQTPQSFRKDVLEQAYAAWTSDEPTDEAQVFRAFGGEVTIIEGSPHLAKLTSQTDFDQAIRNLAQTGVSRTGMGFDVHAFAGDGPVKLGGVSVEHDRGLAGHSDADVCLHAITDALLGAAALGDIGEHFPPSDPRWKGADSETFLAHAASLVRDMGGTVDHIDATIICEAPKVGPHRSAIRSNIARIMSLPETSVSVKATTTEKLGFTGRKEGIAAQAVASIRMPA